MKILDKINVLRRRVMHGVTKNIGSSQSAQPGDLISKAEIKRVLISRPNHRLGNMLLITPLVQEIVATFPECKIDLFVKGNVAPIVFENYENVDRIIKLPKKHFKHLIQYMQGWISIKTNRYDLVVNVVKDSSSGRLSTQLSNSKYKFFGDLGEDVHLEHKDHVHIAKYPVYNFRRYLTGLGFKKNENPIAPLDIKLSPAEISEGEKIIKDLVKNEKKTICVFTYATGAKCYSQSWWEHFYECLKSEYQDYNIIEILPVENVSQISFKAPTFYSKDIRQIASVISNTEVFIGADSGMMHLASAAQTSTIGLFSGTNLTKYQPYHNNSTAIDTNSTNSNACVKIIHGVLSDT